MATIKDKLARFNPEQTYLQRKNLSVKEKGKKYTLTFSVSRLSAVYQVDGDIIKEGPKCDKLILFSSADENDWTEVFVELKGQDISHAIEQLESTLRKDVFKHESVKVKRARIVGRSIPRSTSNSILDRAKKRFFKEHKCDLRAVSPGMIENG